MQAASAEDAVAYHRSRSLPLTVAELKSASLDAVELIHTVRQVKPLAEFLKRIHRAEQRVAASRAELDLAQKRYETDLGNIIELTDVQRRFTQDEADLVSALADFSIAMAALARSSGA